MPANLNEVVADVVELMRVRADEEHVELCWRPAEPMPELVFDPEGIHRAVLNVVTNAIDAVSESETPEGRVEVSSQYVPAIAIARIIVEDNGPGIPRTRWSISSAPSSLRKRAGARAWDCR